MVVWHGGRRLARFLPPVVAYDKAERVLILETASGTRDLTHHHARGRFSRALAGQVGRALACLHEICPEVRSEGFPVGSTRPRAYASISRTWSRSTT